MKFPPFLAVIALSAASTSFSQTNQAPTALRAQGKGGETSHNALLNSGFTKCSTYPRLPDGWQILHGFPVEVKSWTFENFGVDESRPSPVPGTKVLSLCIPPESELEPAPLGHRMVLSTPVGGTNWNGKADEVRTFSFYAVADQAGTPLFLGETKFEIGTEWKRFTYTGKNAASCNFRLRQPGTHVWLAAPQLEAGSVATEYRAATEEPAPVDLSTLPSVTPGWTDHPPALDGKLDDPCWGKAARIELAHQVGATPGKPLPKAEALLLRDGKALYIGYRFAEPEMDKLKPKSAADDSGAVFVGDAIELFVSPNKSGKPYYQFGVNMAGSKFDGKVFAALWNCAWTAKVARGRDSWTVEICIPFSSLPLADADDTWRINVCRDRSRDGGQWSSWAPVGPVFHDSAHFGLLNEMNPKKLDAWKWLVERPVLAKQPDGSFTLSGSFPNRPADVKSVKLSVSPSDTATSSELPAGQTAFAFTGLRLGPDKPLYELVLRGDDAATGKNIFSLPLRVEPSDCDLLWGESPLRAFMEYDFVTDDPTLRGRVRWDGPGKATITAKIVLKTGGKAIDVLKTEGSLGTEQTFSVDLTSLPCGEYELTATAADSGGKKLAVANDTFIKLPKGANEVRLSRFTRMMVVNGKPFFPTFLPTNSRAVSDANVARLKRDGFNTVCAGLGSWSFKGILDNGGKPKPETVAAMRADLDRFDKLGIKVIAWLPDWPACSDWQTAKAVCGGDIHKYCATFASLIDSLKDHPAIVGWYLMDEYGEGKAGFTESDLKVVRDAVRRADPYRPAYHNWNQYWAKEPFGGWNSTDIISLDEYGIGPVLSDQVDNARMLNDRRAGRKPGFLWTASSEGQPARDGVRVHSWLHLVYGTRGVGYWSGVPDNAELWNDITRFNHEAVTLATGPLGGRDARCLGAAVQNGSVHYSLWESGDRLMVLAVNTADEPAALRIVLSAWTGRPAVSVQRVFDPGEIKLADGVLTDQIPPRQRRVYQVTPTSNR